ncbi:hypothetical protein B0T21DRAFT_2013 [Apiosordaria backusii]|uniref:Uncharacterized protein n=1 Tax=Apiosordaria backusii TaxID=314023 RepID=A0AA40EXQ9_9PEZI|nr:hypothetical protein B0T21DRAFT_2013 [Apiosordaria backusii]
MEYKHSIIKHKEDASDAPDPISRTMSAQSYGSDMTMRDAHSGPTMVPANLAPAQQSFVEGGCPRQLAGQLLWQVQCKRLIAAAELPQPPPPSTVLPATLQDRPDPQRCTRLHGNTTRRRRRLHRACTRTPSQHIHRTCTLPRSKPRRCRASRTWG